MAVKKMGHPVAGDHAMHLQLPKADGWMPLSMDAQVNLKGIMPTPEFTIIVVLLQQGFT